MSAPITEEGAFVRSRALPCVILTLALMCLEVWGDAKGSLPTLAVLNSFVQDGAVNGRYIGLLGIVTCCIVASVAPSAFRKANRPLRVITPLLAAMLSFSLAFLSPEVRFPLSIVALLVFLNGACYGWIQVKALGATASAGASAVSVIAVIVVALAGKTLALPLLGMLPDIVQGVVFAALPLVMGGFVVLIDAMEDRGIVRTDASAADEALPRMSFPSSYLPIISMLVILPALNALARAMGRLGLWGGVGVIDGSQLFGNVAALLLLMALAYGVFARQPEDKFAICIRNLLLVLLGGFFVVGSGVLAQGVPTSVASAFETFMELLSNMLFWAAVVVAVRSQRVDAYRAVGIAQAVMGLLAIVLGLALQVVPWFGKTLILLVMYALASCMLMLVGGRAQDSSSFSTLTDEESCRRLAELRGLSPRETDVLLLLAQGRSQSFIADALVVAESTVKTHVRNVYRKLGVDNKQDLISLVKGL